MKAEGLPGPGSARFPAPAAVTGYKPPVDVLLSALVAADCMAAAAADGEDEPARAAFTFW
jgi:hypothetical protein